MQDLEAIAQRAKDQGYRQIAFDVREAAKYVLQCISNSAYQGVLTRARQEGLLTLDEHKEIERRLAVHTCHRDGGICAFNGTGNSSRNVVTGLGLTHPAVELLTEPPATPQINQAVDALFTFVNNADYSVGNIVSRNFANAVRIHSATGGSTNLMMHLVAAMIYAGYDVDVWTIDHIRRHPPVPDLFDYSLSEDRDLFSLARQVCAGQSRGMETVFYELVRHGIPMDADAPTVTGTTWGERLADERNLAAASIADNPIILSTPRRAQSGIEVLQSNFFETAVVKISGMTDAQLGQFDDQIDVVLYYENEEDANQSLLDTHVLDCLATQNRRTQQPEQPCGRLAGAGQRSAFAARHRARVAQDPGRDQRSRA
jgi:dihydroxyacid dehydratase/phosphogluconate dehydratase